MGHLAGGRDRVPVLSIFGRSQGRRRDWNPVLVRELRQRFRGARAFLVLTAMLVVVAAVGGTTVAGLSSRGGFGGVGADVGSTLVIAVGSAQRLLVWLLAPALTATSISGEMERRSWDLLLATPLSGYRIVAGKLGSAMAFVALLLFAGLPVMSLGFVFGGVAPWRIALTWFDAFATGLSGATLGLFFSMLTRSSSRALVASYLTLLIVGSVRSCGSMLVIGVLSAFGTLQSANMDLYQTLGVSLFGNLLPLGISFGLFLATANMVRSTRSAVRGPVGGVGA